MSGYVVMGVSGAGKSTVGELFAQRMGLSYLDGDSLHPQSNIDKMSRGQPLTDADRWPWINAVAARLAGEVDVVACSALKRAYRDRMREVAGAVTFLFLDGAREVLEERMGHRKGHFMPEKMLDSQLATLERPGPDESVVRVDIDRPPEEIVDELVARVRAD
ncbi:gluconokinase [Jannaschia formosa]|uniref:gluconokinase n=1 Tax=Jannaschia formosa TaxID=2259592 RepID=UPI000E1B7FB8|nr:gluconokinase [Jannaschia formosa]TFL19227.1 gluconokinase [Jannaschia formosa]